MDGDGWVEYALYGAPGELPAFPDGEVEVAGVRVRVRGQPVAEDWAERWKRFHKPVLVEAADMRLATAPRQPAPVARRPATPALWVRPPWAEPRSGAIDLVIDPGQAFGTGAHPTTRLCLELLLGIEPRGSLADLGCGSGVLAIAAAKLGFAPVIAVDSEAAALEAARANARANGVGLDRVGRLNLREQPPPMASVVTANLTRPLLLRVAELITAPPGALIVSGLLEAEAGEVAAAFAPLRERCRLRAEGWSALLLTG